MQPIVPPTPAGLKHKNRLFILMLVHLVLSILDMFVNLYNGILNLVLTMILWCANSQMSHCQLIIYMVYCLYDFIVVLCDLGLVL